jgi:cytochrome bd-type quinol oxidase subunit 2
MMAEPSSLALFWAAVIAFAIMVYVILDGFDLGKVIVTDRRGPSPAFRWM